MIVRNAVILLLVFFGFLLPLTGEWSPWLAGIGCWVLAGVYGNLTKVEGGRR